MEGGGGKAWPSAWGVCVPGRMTEDTQGSGASRIPWAFRRGIAVFLKCLDFAFRAGMADVPGEGKQGACAPEKKTFGEMSA